MSLHSANFTYTERYPATATSNLYLDGVLIPNPDDDPLNTMVRPGNAFFYPQGLANTTTGPVLLDPYRYTEDAPASVDAVVNGSLVQANLTASGAPAAVSALNGLGLGLGPDGDGDSLGPLWLNGAALQDQDILSAGDLNPDLTLNVAALLPGSSLSGNATLAITNLASQTTLAAGQVTDGAGNYEPVLLLPASLAVDNNRDGTISLDVDDQTSRFWPFHFWLDDDPVSSGNSTLRYNNPVVDGAADLSNFFPVFLNLQQLVTTLPPGANVTYTLKQADGAVNFVYTNLTQAEAFSYQTGNLTSGFGPDFDQPAANATTQQVTADGVQLSGNFLANIANYNEGVILVQGRTDSKAPLELVVQQNGVTVDDLLLYLSLGPRILLLLHGMNSDTKTWDTLVRDDFGNVTTGATNIFSGNTTPVPNTVPPLTGNGIRCYRLQFGAFDNPGRTGLEGVTSSNTLNYLSGNQCGDFETFDQLGQEVNNAIAFLQGTHPNAQIVLLGHSRGGLAARDFLENPNFSKEQSAVVALLTTSTPHTGSPLALVYSWLGAYPPGSSDPSVPYTLANNTEDWNCVNFLLSKTIFIFWPKPTLDVRRPVIKDVANGSAAITALNEPGAVASLPANIRYAEIINTGVDLGVLKLSGPEYSVLDPTVDYVGYAMSPPAQTYVLGAETESYYTGDGLVPAVNQDFLSLSGFPSGVSTSSYTDPYNVIHTAAPSQTTDLNTELHALEPTWFPPPP